MFDLDEISFAEWLVELNDLAVSIGYLTTESFTVTTGQFEWFSRYESGLSPEEALYQAMEEALEFGWDY